LLGKDSRARLTTSQARASPSGKSLSMQLRQYPKLREGFGFQFFPAAQWRWAGDDVRQDKEKRAYIILFHDRFNLKHRHWY
jgi:hypothetical protein